MNMRRMLTGKLTKVLPVAVMAVLMIALVAIPAGAVMRMTQPAGLTVLNSPGPLPGMLNYQGYLTDSSGKPITATLSMTFAIYSGATGGTPLWTETQPSVSVSNGVFNVLLGSVTPIDAGHLTGESYLGVKVGADAEMAPRQRLASVAYALRADKANDADTLDGKHATDFGGASSVKQLIQDFVVASGKSVTAGDVVGFVGGYVQKGLLLPPPGDAFNSASTLYTSVAALSATKFVVSYQDAGNSNYGTALIGNVSGNTITYGPEYVFNSAVTGYPSVAALSSTKFVVAYQDEGNSNYGTAIIGDVSGNTITYGPEYVFNSATTWDTSVAALSSTKFVVAYGDAGNSSYGTAVIGDVSGNTITCGSEYVFNSATIDAVSVAVLSSTKLVVTYRDYGNSLYGTAVVGDVSGNSITYGSEYVFNPGDSYRTSVAALSSTKLVVAYMDWSNNYFGTAIIGDVSGNTITYGAEYVFNAASTYPSVAVLSSTKFVVAYRDGGNSSYGTAIIGDVSTNTITYGLEYVFNPASSSLTPVVALSSTRLVVAYKDDANSGYGTAKVGNVSGNTITFPVSVPIVYFIGIAKESKTAGQTVPVIIGGVSDVHSGLTPGVIYYSDAAGALTTTATDYKIGLAISPNEILLSMQLP